MSYIEYYNWETQKNHMFSFTEVPRGENKKLILRIFPILNVLVVRVDKFKLSRGLRLLLAE